MKNLNKALASIPVLAFFLYLAWACSYDKDYLFPKLIEVQFNNQSDSCLVKNLELIYRVRRDNNDTLNLGIPEIVPGDSLNLELSVLNYQKMNYTCDCPGHVFNESRNVQLDTVGVNMIGLDCD